MPLKKEKLGVTEIEPSPPEAETITQRADEIVKAAQKQAAGDSQDAREARKAEEAKRSEDSGDPREKFYVTKTGYMRDPISGITYVKGRPMPGSKSGWLRCQVAAGVIIEYKQGEMGD